MLRLPTMGRSSGDLARAFSGVQYQAELTEFSDAAGDSIHCPSHAYREFHVGHIGKEAKAVKDFLLPVGEVLGQERVGVEASVRDAHGRVVRLQPMILLAVRPFPGAF